MQPPKCAKRTPPNDNEAPPEKRRNEGGDVFLGVARDARCDQRRQEKPGPDKGGRLAVSGKNFWRPCTLNWCRNFQCAKEFLTPLGAPGGAL